VPVTPFLQTSYPRLALACRICRACCDTHDRAYNEGADATRPPAWRPITGRFLDSLKSVRTDDQAETLPIRACALIDAAED
jgi:hypothetical protein